jgi:uncharacterized repeat protein (TIGR01451 family)
MNSLLTNIAGQFAKPLLLSGLLPVVVITSLFFLVTYPLFPFSLPGPLTSLDSSWQVVWSTLLALVAAMLLYVLNTPIARFFSGYPWKSTPLGWLMSAWHRYQFKRLKERRDGLLTLWDSLPDVPHSRLRDRLWSALTPLARRLNQDFPYAADLVLPTRLGNVIRNFEEYSTVQYGVSVVPLWPRLVGVLEARYATVLEDAKTSFDFALNCLVLLCGATLLTVALAIARDARGDVLVAAALRVALFSVLAGLAYAAAVDRARGWGTHVKAAVDLYRTSLLKTLGYQHTILDIADECARVWPYLASEWSFPDMRAHLTTLPFAPAPAPPAPATTVRSHKGDTPTVTRGVATPRGKRFASTKVTLRLQNAGRTDAEEVTVTDGVPPNWSFVWGSEKASSGTVQVKGSQPLVLEIDRVAAGETCTLRYELQSLVEAS